jgi:DNA-binding MarR family transcriptional regulator
MSRGVQETSLLAYDKMRHHGRIGRSQSIVLERIRLATLNWEPYHDITNAELGDALGWSINRITPRVLELREMGLVERSSVRQCTFTRNMANAWRARP